MGSLITALPRPLARFKGPISKGWEERARGQGKEKQGKGEKEREDRGEKGEGGKGKGLEGVRVARHDCWGDMIIDAPDTTYQLVTISLTDVQFQFHVIIFEILHHQSSHCSAIHSNCQKPPTSSRVQTTTGDMPSGEWKERRPEFQNFVHYFIYLSISCLKLTHSFNFFIAHGKIP